MWIVSTVEIMFVHVCSSGDNVHQFMRLNYIYCLSYKIVMHHTRLQIVYSCTVQQYVPSDLQGRQDRITIQKNKEENCIWNFWNQDPESALS